jgi:tRNA-dihydrouridine synthase
MQQALMRAQGTRFEKIMKALRSVTDCSLSVKLRTGVYEGKPVTPSPSPPPPTHTL